MALVLNATAGDSAANSYCTVAEGDTYHEGHAHADTWTDASATEKAAALVMATRLMDALFEWEGIATTHTQALLWPRQGILNFVRRQILDNASIPDRLKNATAEFARQLLDEDRSLDSDIQTKGLTSLTAGDVSMAFKDLVFAKVVPDATRNLIPSWWGHLRSQGGILEVRRS